MSDKITREQIDKILEELKDPINARNFLMGAGIIDGEGELTEPYKPVEDLST